MKWKVIPGYGGKYEIREDGVVRSVARRISGGRTGSGRPVPGRDLSVNNDLSYPRVQLYGKGESKWFGVEALLAITFGGLSDKITDQKTKGTDFKRLHKQCIKNLRREEVKNG